MSEARNAEERYTLERARAVLHDHAHGLHDAAGAVEGDECRYPGCDEAFWIIARHEEATAP